MATRRLRPSKPMAVFGAIGGTVILVIGIVASLSGDSDMPVGLLVLWVAFGLAIIGFNLWSAFAKGGHSYTFEDA